MKLINESISLCIAYETDGIITLLRATAANDTSSNKYDNTSHNSMNE